jgi:sulfoxide reductase heme-binding subunit YedZ
LLHRADKPLLFVACALPFGWLLWGAATDGLGANPAEALIRGSGDWTLRLLCLTLAVTPLRQLTGWHALARCAACWGSTPSSTARCMPWPSPGWTWAWIRRPSCATSPSAPSSWSAPARWLLMLPLAATSFNRAIRALGAARWQALHRAVYAVALLALLHFFWMRAGKNDFAEWAVYAAIVALLLGWRLWKWRQRVTS